VRGVLSSPPMPDQDFGVLAVGPEVELADPHAAQQRLEMMAACWTRWSAGSP